MAAIGILGGMGPQASAHLLRLLVRDAPKHSAIVSDTDFPEIIVLSVPVPNFIANKHNFNHARRILIERTRQLERAGCTVNGIACNTAHLLLPTLQAITPVPFVSIPKLVAETIRSRGDRRVGLLATPNTLTSTLFDDALGPDTTLVRPSSVLVSQSEKLIFKQLKGEITAADTAALHQIVNRFISTQQLDSVILGCTELPLIFGDQADTPVLDTLQILSEGLLKHFYTARTTEVSAA